MEWLFLAVGFVAILSAAMMLTRKNAVHSALFLIINFGCVAFLYLMLDAPFLSMVQIAVYAGAIMVLFLFVIMLLGAEITTDTSGRMRWLGLAAAVVAGIILVLFGFPVANDGLLNDDNVAERQSGIALVRVINAIPANPSEQILIAEAGFDPIPSTNDVLATITLDSVDDSVEDVMIAGADYADERESIRSYTEIESGEYVLNVFANADDFDYTLLNETVNVQPDTASSVIVYENLDGVVTSSVTPDDLSATAPGKMRLTVFNAVSGTALSLVDIGQYSQVDSLCDAANCARQLPNRRLTDALPFGETTTIALDEGTYNLAFIDDSFNVHRVISDFKAVSGEVQTRLLVFEPADLAGIAQVRAIELSAVARPAFGSPQAIGQILFVDYLLPVQLVGILLLVALIGVIVLARPDALAQAERRRVNRRRRVSRPLVSVISQQTGSDVLSGEYQPKLSGGSDDPQAE